MMAGPGKEKREASPSSALSQLRDLTQVSQPLWTLVGCLVCNWIESDQIIWWSPCLHPGPPRISTGLVATGLTRSCLLCISPSLHLAVICCSVTKFCLTLYDGKASAYNAGDPGSNPGSGGSPGEGNGNPLQYSCLENPMDGGTW